MGILSEKLSNMEGGKLSVKAIYKFKASNNDELSFKKGEVITVTQKEDGGWWEGTSHGSGKTGWFPSNYVKPVESPEEKIQHAAAAEESTSEELQSKQTVYREQLIAELVDKELDFVQDLSNLWTNFLEPLRRSADILSEAEWKQLAGNLDEMVQVHRELHLLLAEETAEGPSKRIGKVLLGHGALAKAAHLIYWSNHPKAVCVFEKHRDALDAFMESMGAPKPGLMFLTTGLSRPFRHIERYTGLMQEVEQHLPDDHPDRGDTQRSIGFYKSVASECAKLRRQKELELQVLSGSIRGWEGDQSIAALGDILHMGSVAVGTDHTDRYLVMFHHNLLILSVSSRMSAFIYEGKLPLTGIAVNLLEDCESVRNSFEITGSMIDRILCICQTKADSHRWVEKLKHQIKVCRQPSVYAGLNPPPPPHKPPQSSPGSAHKMPHIGSNHKGYAWKMSCLRPAPPTRSFLQSVSNSGSKKKDPETTYDEDMQILRVIEAYCSSSAAKQRQTFANSTIIECSHPVTVDDDNNLDDLSEVVKFIKEQLSFLKNQNRTLKEKFEEEVQARRRLEQILRNNLLPNRPDIEWNDA